MALDATVGGADANSYLTRTQGDEIASARLFVSGWTAASDDDKDAVLQWASRVIDQNMCFLGNPVAASQAMKWPRSGLVDKHGNSLSSAALPTELKFAVFELALALLGGDRTAEPDQVTEGLSKLKAGPVELTFKDDFTGADAIPANVKSQFIASWLCPDESRDLVFEVL